MLSQLDLKSKGQGHSKVNVLGNKKHASQKNLSKGSLSNWCEADEDEDGIEDADMNISKTICRPPPWGGLA